jgi:UDP-N-acetylglucosamine 2-epimerase (non-hydrolysing)
MPEEINRIVTDALADVLYTPSSDADENLRAEGVEDRRIVRVGNVMIDTLVHLLPSAQARWCAHWQSKLPERYGVVTLHRPSNVDDPAVFEPLLEALIEIGRDLPLVFPVHPRTVSRIEAALAARLDRVQLMEPVGYLDFLALQQHAAMVITDSGGIQEESTYLRVPCLTVRQNTERPVTVAIGTNTLVGHDFERLVREASAVAAGQARDGAVPPLWDGQTAERIAADLLERIS